MDLRQLGYFVTIAEQGGFAAAARSRYISQSALSRQVQLLEEEMGTQLLERSSRGIVLTPAGQILLERSRRLFMEVSHLREDVLAEAETPSGRIVLGLTPSMRALFGGNLVEGFLRRYSSVHLGVIEGLSHSMADSVARGLCDVAVFIRDDAKGRALSTRKLLDEPMVIAAQARAGLRMDTPVDVAWVAQHPLIVSRSNRVTSGLEKEALRIGKPLNIIIDVQPLHLSIDLVCRGLAHMVVPFSAAVTEYEAGFISMAPIKGFNTGWVVAWPSDRRVSAASLRLVEAVQSEVASLHLDESLKRAMR
jgi:LysR family nitrogen assimilation transcriptional regulator